MKKKKYYKYTRLKIKLFNNKKTKHNYKEKKKISDWQYKYIYICVERILRVIVVDDGGRKVKIKKKKNKAIV